MLSFAVKLSSLLLVTSKKSASEMKSSFDVWSYHRTNLDIQERPNRNIHHGRSGAYYETGYERRMMDDSLCGKA